MEPQSPLRQFAALLAGASFVAVVQLSPSKDLSTTHVLAIRCFAFSIPALIGFYVIGISLDSGLKYLNLIWQFLYAAGFASALGGMMILFLASDATSAIEFGGMICVLLVSYRLRLRSRMRTQSPKTK